jgi:hypothetical protein
VAERPGAVRVGTAGEGCGAKDSPSLPMSGVKSQSTSRRPGSVPSRLAYLDNLKVLLVVGVIAVHAAITYGLGGS